MQSIALIADLHANRAAIEAADADIRARGIERIFFLGDAVGKGPDPVYACDYVRANCEVALGGNWDLHVVQVQGSAMIDWYKQELGETRLRWLAQLPLRHSLTLGGRKIVLAHGRPLHPDPPYPEGQREERMEGLYRTIAGNERDASVVGYADMHRSGLAMLYGGRMLFNTGSVGNSLKGNRRACYAILHEHTHGVGVEFVQLEYDIEKTLARVREREDFPKAELAIRELETGLYSR